VVTPEATPLSSPPGRTPTDLRELGCVRLRPNTEIVALAGVGQLEAIVLRDLRSGRLCTRPAAALYLLVAGRPRTEWVPPDVQLDARGFVRTAAAGAGQGRTLDHETTLTGVFAAGTVRSGAPPGAGAVADGLGAARAILRSRK
jgi:thioredoxin reductase (NADPH)